MLNYLEKAFGTGNVIQGDNGNILVQQSKNLIEKLSSVPSSSLVSDVSTSDLAANVNASENQLSRSLSDDPLEELFSSVDIGGQNLSRSAGLTSANNLPRTTIDRSISGVDLKLKLQLYKVRFLLLTRNVNLAKREVKHAMNIARGRDSSMILLLKAQLEYTRGNHKKAIKLLMASMLFSKALSNCSSLLKEKPLNLLTFSQDKSFQITYNCGLQYFTYGKPKISSLFPEDYVGKDGWGLGGDRQPMLSLPLARQCFYNALHLLKCSDSSHLDSFLLSNSSLKENESYGGASSKNSNHNILHGIGSKASTLRGNQMIEQPLLTNLAYVELELENPLKALSTHGHVYAAEAPCLLNKPREAAEYLSVYLSRGNNVELPFAQEDCEQW
ncbi:uncharacterized protein LOC120169326 [Hibiscus syriacus]|uniref:uncharacterized protein LOC120169326 n=1 Tax=Hibiscus syriacus TaxID=106335 RepID=UPI001920F7D2|nr:uncharacterized protein LOC120169326 [Hibiscus syriacus]